MVLDPGARVGPFEILGPCIGGPGQAYEARDLRTGRAARLDFLDPALDGPDLDRREAEALAAADLGHPGILGALETGSQGTLRYIATPWPEGETLAERLGRGALAPAEAAALAAQVARGIDAAHARSLVHGGLAPGWIRLGEKGVPGILGFGLAPGGPGGVEADIRGLGILLQAMLTGEADPGPATLQGVPAALQGVLEACLARAPEARFHSALDLAFALEGLAPALEPSSPLALFAAGSLRVALLWAALGLGLVLAAGILGWALHRPPLEGVRVQQLNFPTGTIESARFAPDGRRVYFSLRAGGRPPEIYVSDPDSAEPRPLGIRDAIVLAVSSREELAFLQGPVRRTETTFVGALMVASGKGGTPARLRDRVLSVAWDGQGMAILNETGTRQNLEFPPGRLTGSWDEPSRMLEHLALSADGSLLACIDTDDLHALARIDVLDRSGGWRTLYTRGSDGGAGLFSGLAWGPRNELWVSEQDGDQSTLWALTLKGARRVLWRGQGNLQLMDVSREGRALMVQQTARRSVYGLRAGASGPVDLSIQGQTQLRGISPDGAKVLLNESPVGDGGSPTDRCYLRSVDGGPIQALGKGYGLTFSRDGRWVQVDLGIIPVRELPSAWSRALRTADPGVEDPGKAGAFSWVLFFVPAAGGKPVTVKIPKPFDPDHSLAYLLPGGRGVLANVNVQGHPAWIRLDGDGGQPVILTPPGREFPPVASLDVLSSDGTRMILAEIDKKGQLSWYTLPLSGGALQPIRGLLPGERVVGWAMDGASVFLRSGWDQLPVRITRMALKTGARTPAFSFSPLDPAGFMESRDAFVAPDGRTCAIDYEENFSDLYVAEGLGQGI